MFRYLEMSDYVGLMSLLTHVFLIEGVCECPDALYQSIQILDK